MTLEELHKAYMQAKETNEDYDYENDTTQENDNEFTVLKNIFDIKRGGR
jgi:hypothetical protein